MVETDNTEWVEVGINNDTLSWKPSHPGDEIIGEYIKTETGKGRGEGLLFHHLIDDDDFEVSILGSTVLNKKLENVEPGTIIKIVYNGKSKSKNGREYNDFKVFSKQD